MLGIHNVLFDMSIYTKIDLNSLRRECGNLDELLISTSDVQIDDLLGEGIMKSATTSYIAMVTMHIDYWMIAT